MPRLLAYDAVHADLIERGLVCNYPSGGAFAFGRGASFEISGWIGPEDSTIKPAALEKAQRVAAPYAQTLAAMARGEVERLGGEAWVMPMSHWAYELQHGSIDWLPDALKSLGLDPPAMATLNNAAAVVFSSEESMELERVLVTLLEHLADSSDFMLVVPQARTLCLIHHHQQLWWMMPPAKASP